MELENVLPPNILWHGTGEKFLDSILQHGLVSKSRLYVHLSSDYDTAVKIGSRHGKTVVFKVLAEKMSADKFDFFLSKNKVWLTKQVPKEYLQIIDR